MQEVDGGVHCQLLQGREGCATCPTPYPPSAGLGLTVKREPGVTTIARVTCPTAPRFWRWHSLPLPRLVPREVLLPDEAEHEQEWKLQLLAAALCGGLGLAGFFVGAGRAQLILYILAYASGAWFTIHEVWERLQKRHLDVHFLMLAVAAGSASIGAWGEGAMLLVSLFAFRSDGALRDGPNPARDSIAVSRRAESRTLNGCRRARTARCPSSNLRAGMRLLVKPGEQFPGRCRSRQRRRPPATNRI